MKRVLVTGGAGFIGSAVVRRALQTTDWRIWTVDCLTYAGSLDNLREVAGHPNHAFVKADICDQAAMTRLFDEVRPDAVIHLAAESHVDRSIAGPKAFIQTNVSGTVTLLEAARALFATLTEDEKGRFRFLHVSTDEVYGELGDTGTFSPDSPYRPNSPYSASKAAADHMVRAWGHTYGLPVLVSNCSNNYGPYQYPEKLIPVILSNAMAGRSLPVYGRGLQVRDWVYVDDHAEALLTILERGGAGETYCVGGNQEVANLDLVERLCAILDELRPDPAGPYRRLISFVRDRPGHDWRYAIDSGKLMTQLGWAPQHGLEDGLRQTVRWYMENVDWCEKALARLNDLTPTAEK